MNTFFVQVEDEAGLWIRFAVGSCLTVWNCGRVLMCGIAADRGQSNQGQLKLMIKPNLGEVFFRNKTWQQTD